MLRKAKVSDVKVIHRMIDGFVRQLEGLLRIS